MTTPRIIALARACHAEPYEQCINLLVSCTQLIKTFHNERKRDAAKLNTH